MVAHCCEASINFQLTERKVQALAPFPPEVDLHRDH